MSSSGAPLDRVDGPLKVCGQAHSTGDMALPRMAHAVLVTRTAWAMRGNARSPV